MPAWRSPADELKLPTLQVQILRGSNKPHQPNFEPEHLVALTVEAAARAGVPLVGTDWIPGHHRH